MAHIFWYQQHLYYHSFYIHYKVEVVQCETNKHINLTYICKKDQPFQGLREVNHQ